MTTHNERVRAEFTRQSEAFRDSRVLAAVELTTRIADALGGGHERVLDIACGPGILFPTLARCAETVVGVDLTLKQLQLAREAVGGSAFCVQSLSERLPFRAASFDAAVVRLALHHFTDPLAALSSARSVLRTGGRLVVLDLVAPRDVEARPVRDALERFRDPSHARLLSVDEMREQLVQAGFGPPVESLWSQRRQFDEWAQIIHEPRRMSDFRLILDALAKSPRDSTGLELGYEGNELWFTHDWGLFVAAAV